MELLDKYSDEIMKIKVEPAKIDLVNKFIEAYDNTGMVTTIDPKEGILGIWVTEDTRPIMHKILKYIPVKVEFLED